MKFGESVQAGARLIDGEGVEDYGTSEVIKQRLKMSTDGVLTVAVAVTDEYVLEPVIGAYGCVFSENSEIDTEVKTVIRRTVENFDYSNHDKADFSTALQKAIKTYFYKKTKQAPMIIVSVIEV